MLENVTLQETDTFEEVNKILNKCIDNLNLVESKVLVLDKQSAKKPAKKKRKGIVSMKTLLAVVCFVVLLCSTAFSEFQQISFDNITNPTSLELILRERLGRTGDTFTFPNGLTIDNATNNAFTITENSEDLILTFSSNAVALSSSTTVTSFDFGTVDPTCDQLTLENAAVISNATDGDVTIAEGGEDLTLRFSTNNVELLSSLGVLGVDFNDLYIIFAEISAPSNNPANGLGWLYVKDNSGTTDLYFEGDDGQVVELTASASGVANLDEAYDAGGSGTGRTITADSGAMVLNNTDQDAAFLLSVTPTPSGSAATGGIQITSGGNSSEDSLQIVNSGTGDDIQAGAGAFTLSKTGVLATLSLDATGTGGLTLANDETVTNNTETEIAFTDSSSSEDIIIDLDAGTDAVGWKSGSGVDEWAFGDVDDLTGVSTVVFDATSVSMTHTPDAGGEDFTIQQNGTTQDTSIVIATAGTPADALQLTASAGGIDISATSSDAGDDIDITASGTSVNITATENVEDSIVISSSNAGINITAAGAAAGEDIDITATGSSINIIATENQANAIVIDASDAAGGIDMDAGTGNIDIDIATGDFLVDGDLISIDGTGLSNITVTADAGSEHFTIAQAGSQASNLILSSAGTGADALQVKTSAGGIDIQATTNNDAEDLDIAIIGATDSSVDITSSGTANDAVIVEATVGGIDINAKEMLTLDVAAGTAGTADITITNTPGTDAEAIYLNAVAGGMKLHVPDGKEAIMGHIGDDTYVKVAPHGTAADEIISIVNAAGSADGAIVLTSTAGGIDINAKEMFTVNLAGGTVGTTDITFTNTPGTDEAAIALVATAGGVDIDAAAGKNIDISGGQLLMTSKTNEASAISMIANQGGNETIVITNTQGTNTAAVGITASAGGITMTADGANGVGVLALNALINIGVAGVLADNATPDVSDGTYWETGAATTYTDFDVGTGQELEGTIIIIKSLHNAVFDVTGSEIEGGTTDITTASGDVTGLIYDGTAKWRVLFRMDMSDDLN